MGKRIFAVMPLILIMVISTTVFTYADYNRTKSPGIPAGTKTIPGLLPDNLNELQNIQEAARVSTTEVYSSPGVGSAPSANSTVNSDWLIGWSAAMPEGTGNASDIFLKIDGIPGESTDSKHKNEIEPLSFAFGTNPSADTGSTSLSAVRVVKHIDKASPDLLKAMLQGERIESATIVVRQAGGQMREYLKVVLSDVTVSSYRCFDTPHYLGCDEIYLAFSKIEFCYTTYNSSGQAETKTMTWDLRTNSPY